MQLMQVRAQSRRQPPPLFGLELVEVDQNRIKVRLALAGLVGGDGLRTSHIALACSRVKISWQRCPRDHELVYIVQVLEWDDHEVNAKMGQQSTLHWESASCRETGVHTIYNLRSQRTYCIRVSTGFTPTRPGRPCPPLFITTLAPF